MNKPQNISRKSKIRMGLLVVALVAAQLIFTGCPGIA